MDSMYEDSDLAMVGLPQNTALPASSAPISEPTRRPATEAMDSTTGVYQGFITNPADFERVRREYLSRNDIAREEVTDVPQTAEEQRGLIKKMFEAAQDCSQTYEPSQSQSVRRIQSGAYTDVEWELILWPLLMSACSAQEGRCQLPRYLGCKIPQYNAYESFTERLNAIVEALRLSKALVVSLFKDSTFIDRLAWRPKSELSLKATNRKLNENRDIQNAVGLRVVNRDGIKADEEGRLVDPSGRVYGNVKKRSAVLEDTLARSKKRSRNSQRDSFSSSSTSSPPVLRGTTSAPVDGSSLGGSPSLVQSHIGPGNSMLDSLATEATRASTSFTSTPPGSFMGLSMSLTPSVPSTSASSTTMPTTSSSPVGVNRQLNLVEHQGGAAASSNSLQNT
ncbi:hypothetical protein F5Y05DRAFT_407663 [Hypoxylon sp. FL0543]|nr:hypothetical protein F5Y05DRAFT_407663 [Hypoxylon sp. FL0543]